ncbi:MAG: prolyl oligopeptidase family serine peptidase [Candidatus Cloacimonetes bacterium]|nr:prolyl oligopeptidase family serine peptidase [Candidatus Cloacimonadota bacterium]
MKRLIIVMLLSIIVAGHANETWRQPDAALTALFDARRTPSSELYPEAGKILFWERPGYTPLEMLAWPVLRLGGRDITPLNNGGRRTSYLTDPWLLDVVTRDSLRLPLPPGAICGSEASAPDGHAFAFNQYTRDGITLWRYDFASNELRALLSGGINQILGDSFQWMPDNRHLLVRMVAPQRGDAPEPSAVPVGPTIYETSGVQKQLRTHSGLLRSDHDEALFHHYFTTQFVLVDTHTGEARVLGEPGLYISIQPSPDGRYFIARVLDESLSRRLPWWGFAQRYELWDADGETLDTLCVQPSRENVPLGGVLTGPRNYHWQPWEPHTLVWMLALDEGDPANEVEYREVIYYREADSALVKPLRRLRHRYSGIEYVSAHEAIFHEYDRERRWSTSAYVNLADHREHIIEDISTQDMYGRQGIPVTQTHQPERVLVRDDAIFLSGPGYTPDGAYPFIDRLDLTTFEKTRIWQSQPDSFERLEGFWGEETLAVWSESPQRPPNMALARLADDSHRELTEFVDDAAILSTLSKRLVTYERDDGLPLSGMLYLPPDWDGVTRLPLVIQAYPDEFVEAGTAGQVRNSENRYTRTWGASSLYFCLNGYAVLRDAKIAVVGDPETVNETFIEQVVSSAAAAIAHLDSTGVIDPARVAVTGHSYGAFMVVNLLAHSDLFAAGIAKNGAYNRTLTPFGFQSERRNLWEATSLYLRVSPLLHADSIDEPLLLVHSQEDTNSGTYPMQSKRLFEALDGLGKNCRYIELPLEEHGYRARETHLHLLAEYLDFLGRWLSD